MQTLALNLTHPYLTKSKAFRDFALILGGSLLMGLLAQVSLPLLYSPVPVTGQTFGVLILGATLGSRRGAASLALYLLEGLAGFPVLAAASLYVTAGYLVGFIAAAYVIGLFAERGWDRDWKKALPMFLAGEVVIFVLGVAWIAHA